ncbi:dual specificity protein phosphatase family protein [Heliorestis convoluta]|uniref:Dual specificity protein phosphatase family protein n=1 Tax=Heliorestis convoluta TaxID=356322 RepID=A0A5Q2MYJ8_9FIRM|nr:dual specificity protein phosphatase [Heliorestis convoluta]QGG48004.1 dual specificity protein phosphatase family protein [Heliorestis convoluta]
MATKIFPWLYLGGEEEVESIIDRVDIWIDFRDEDIDNLFIKIPENVVVIRMPFLDGDEKAAKKIYPIAKLIIDTARRQNKKILISCHMGISRSATLALWLMAEEMGYEKAYRRLKSIRSIVCPDRRFQSIIQWIKGSNQNKNHM